MCHLAEGILSQGKARRVRILDEYVSDEQRSPGAKAPGQMVQLFIYRALRVVGIIS